jgi:hypothetical protein
LPLGALNDMGSEASPGDLVPLRDTLEPMTIIVRSDDTLAQELDKVRKRDGPTIIVALKQKNRSTLQRSELTQ